jgi:transposase
MVAPAEHCAGVGDAGRIVLRCAEGGTIGEVAQDIGVSRNMVSNRARGSWLGVWRTCRMSRVRGRPRLISDEQIEEVITKTLEDTPGHDTHWPTRSMASATEMSQSAISRTWRAFGLKPHAVQTWKLSTSSSRRSATSSASTWRRRRTRRCSRWTRRVRSTGYMCCYPTCLTAEHLHR